MSIEASYDVHLSFTDISEKYHEIMDAWVETIDGTLVSARTLGYRGFDHKVYGQQLNTQPPRFSFHFDNHQRVEEYLGPDANTNGHMHELVFHLGTILDAHPEIREQLGEGQLGILAFALYGHDMDETTHDEVKWACGGVTGDIMHSMKTDEDRRLQKKIRQKRDRDLYADIPDETLKIVEGIISGNDKSILGILYRASHELQCLDTTQVAERTLVSGLYDNTDEMALQHIAFEVRKRTLSDLVPFIGTFACIGDMLKSFDPAA